MTNRVAIKIMLGLLLAVLLFHISIMTKIVPYKSAWGGRLQNDAEMYVFEIMSIMVNLFLGFVLLMKGGYRKHCFKQGTTNRILRVFLILFVLNTVGNIFAKTDFERSFALVTLAFAVLIGIVLKDKRSKQFEDAANTR